MTHTCESLCKTACTAGIHIWHVQLRRLLQTYIVGGGRVDRMLDPGVVPAASRGSSAYKSLPLAAVPYEIGSSIVQESIKYLSVPLLGYEARPGLWSTDPLLHSSISHGGSRADQHTTRVLAQQHVRTCRQVICVQCTVCVACSPHG